ncbi:MAG TPA: hemerythrin domain-containing protein [Anaerolineae bacterium]|nr:hemerythrin domain-containing protein [Anaerolineae bacterium]
MSQPEERNIEVSFTAIHKIITRGLSVSWESALKTARQGFQTETGSEGLLKFVQALSSVLRAHHLTEDELAFPFFRSILTQAPFDLLMRRHEEMAGTLDEVLRAAEELQNEGRQKAGLSDLADALGRLNEAWKPHIQMEADELIAKADALVPVEEQLRLTRLFAEHGQRLSVPPYLTVPFLLYNLPEEDRAAFSRGMPAEVLSHLVPVVWRQQWAPMTPYLLT